MTQHSRLRLRLWQRKALDLFLASAEADFLAVATPGAGKTTFALAAARLSMPNLPGPLVVVVPTRHLKEQWADAAQRFGFQLVVDWQPGDRPPPDSHGVVTTYQQVGSSAAPFFMLSQGGFVILDEIHHAGEERTWGDGVRDAFEGASRRLSLSGTPFRSDTRSIPFVRYEDDEAIPDIEYGYGQALADRSVVRPVFFPRFGGHMEWMAPSGDILSATFDDALARTQANQRLRAALSMEGQWLPSVLEAAHQQLKSIREHHVDAGGLVIASDQDHARDVADYLKQRFDVGVSLVTSDDPDASKKIAAFAEGKDPWVVAVRMISEGVDIPRLRLAVYATTTTTELFFRQAVGRVVRFTPGGGTQRAYMFVPDDVRLRSYAVSIADSRRHSLRKNDRETGERDAEREVDQMSLFAVLSATATDGPSEDDILSVTDLPGQDPLADTEGVDFEELTLDLGLIPLPAGGPSAPPAAAGPSARHERDRLRRINTNLAKELAELTGRPHATVNDELNRRAGIAKVSEATILQLGRRSRAAEEWIRVEQRRRRTAQLR